MVVLSDLKVKLMGGMPFFTQIENRPARINRRSFYGFNDKKTTTGRIDVVAILNNKLPVGYFIII